jgi:hypothetical protein
MLIEQRIYQLRPGKLHEFLRLYEAEGLAIQSDVLGNLIGYFSTEVGELNCVVQLWGFDSFEDRQVRRSALSTHVAWRDFAGRTVALVEKQTSSLLTPASFSPIR